VLALPPHLLSAFRWIRGPALILLLASALGLGATLFARNAKAAGVEVLSISVSAANIASQDGLLLPANANPNPNPSVAAPASEPEAYWLSADIRIAVSAKMEELLERGVPLYFVTEVEVLRPRWYWADESVFKTAQSVRLSYQALTRQYRVTRGALGLSFTNLGDALRAVGTVRAWRIADSRAFASRSSHDLYVRFRLDKSQLPKPFQLTMITESEWAPASEWKRFSFTPEPIKTAP
jgi:hypothetical protein